ncbi:MAG: trehalase family glycosidase [Candidatus Paceibacterota bacterium]
MQSLNDRIEKLMLENRREAGIHQYTVPSPDLYPFQWLWDSCFHAIILSYFDVDAAKQELRAAFSHPLVNGMIPHIIYWQHDTAQTNWGREMRGDVINAAWGVVGTSAITQPPIMAMTAWRIYEKDNDIVFLQEIFAVLSKHYRYLCTDRRLGSSPLAFIINPDESGEDNSPRFDNAQGLAPQHTANQNLDRRIDRMRENALCDFMARDCMSKHFAIIDVPFNIFLSESLEFMSQIAALLDETDDADYFNTEGRKVSEAVSELLCTDSICSSYDSNGKTAIETQTWSMFMPLYGGLLSQEDANELVEKWLLNAKHFWTEFPVPSTSIQELSFDATKGFWRGPVWIAPNWIIYKGLKRYGFDTIADEIKEKTEALINKSGFREHYNPHTGAGLGANNFTWGGLVIDMT